MCRTSSLSLGISKIFISTWTDELVTSRSAQSRIIIVETILNICCFAQGYALVEYETMRDAQAAIDGMNNTQLLEQTILCDYAFVRPPPAGPKKGRGGRGRSASPARRN